MKKPKRELTRIVRSPQGEVDVDPTGRANGRGAYLCTDSAQWLEAVAKGRLAHALKLETGLTAEDKDRLLQYASGLPAKRDEQETSGITTTGG